MAAGPDGDLRLPSNDPRGGDATPVVRPMQVLLPKSGPRPAPGGDVLIDIDLLEYGRILLKNRWVIAASMVLALAAGAAITWMMQPLYSAQSTVQIDREAAKVVNVQDVTPSDELVSAEEFFQTQYGLLRSRSLAMKVDDALHLSRDDAFIHVMGGKAPHSTGERRDEVVDLLRQHLGINPVRGSRLVSITFESPQPALSADIANAFAENFISANLDRRFESASYARDFLERRLAQVKAKLEDSEKQLVAYATQEHIIQLTEHGPDAAPGDQQSLASASLETLNNALAVARTQRIEAEQKWRAAQGGSDFSLPEILQNPTVQQLSQTRAQLQASYQDKLRIFKPDYPEMQQLKAQIDETDRQLKAQAATIRASMQSQYTVALNNERQLSGQVEQLTGQVLDLRRRSIQYTILQREVDTNRSLYDGLLQRYKEVGVAGGVSTNNISIVDRAEPPRAPSSPQPVLNLAIAAAAGLAMGIAVAFLREIMDQAVRVPADVETKLGLPMLGATPMLEKGVQPEQALADTRSPLSEAYHSLRSALQFSTTDGFPRTLLVTSTRPGEGKSTTAIALAQNMARLGYRTLLVDADLRDPSLHKSMGADNRAGLSSVLTGAAKLAAIVQPTDTENLYVVPSGPLPPNPAELLSSNRLQLLVVAAISQFDMAIFDGPPVMGLADAPMIASSLTGTLLVIEAGRTGRAQARAALRRLAMANAHILGAVLTKFNPRQSGYGYGHGYGYGYGYEYGAQRPGELSALQGVSARARRLMRK
ncbi:MAG: GumC family protein [Caulobacterales bacterium]